MPFSKKNVVRFVPVTIHVHVYNNPLNPPLLRGTLKIPPYKTKGAKGCVILIFVLYLSYIRPDLF